jgi:PadR family transcriptional regulator, regulatory protein PadR
MTVAPRESGRETAGPPPRAGAGGPGASDPLIGDLRRAGLLPMLVLHLVAGSPSYGNRLIERVGDLTGGAVAVNPNTMYRCCALSRPRGC